MLYPIKNTQKKTPPKITHTPPPPPPPPNCTGGLSGYFRGGFLVSAMRNLMQPAPTHNQGFYLLPRMAVAQLFSSYCMYHLLVLNTTINNYTSSAGILQSMGARNRVRIELSYRPARLYRLAESLARLLKSLQIRDQNLHFTCTHNAHTFKIAVVNLVNHSKMK